MDAATLKEAGWTTLDVGGFTGLVGPFWIRGRGGPECEVGLLIEPRHSNNHLGTIHGGVVMTFADIALGVGVAGVLGGPYCATAQVQIHFVSTANIGEFIICRPEVVRQSRQLVFMRGLIKAGEKTVGAVDGIWKVLDQKPRTS